MSIDRNEVLNHPLASFPSPIQFFHGPPRSVNARTGSIAQDPGACLQAPVVYSEDDEKEKDKER